MQLPPELSTRVSNQHGLLTRANALAYDIDRHRLNSWVRQGDLRQLSSQVFAVAAAPTTEHQAVLAAVLDSGPGSFASHHTALALFGLPGFELLPAHVLRRRSGRSHPTALGSTHTSRWLQPSHVVELHRIPVTTPTRTPFDIAHFLHPMRLELVIDRLASRRLTSYALLHDMLDQVARRGQPLTRLMRTFLDARPPGTTPAESGLEARFEQIMREAGVTTLERQVDMGDNHTWLGRMDFADRHLPYVAQIDSDLYHTALVDQVRDAEQTRRLEAAGLVVSRIPEFDVWYRRDRVIETVRLGLARAAAQRNRSPKRSENRPVG